MRVYLLVALSPAAHWAVPFISPFFLFHIVPRSSFTANILTYLAQFFWRRVLSFQLNLAPKCMQWFFSVLQIWQFGGKATRLVWQNLRSIINIVFLYFKTFLFIWFCYKLLIALAVFKPNSALHFTARQQWQIVIKFTPFRLYEFVTSIKINPKSQRAATQPRYVFVCVCVIQTIRKLALGLLFVS